MRLLVDVAWALVIVSVVDEAITVETIPAKLVGTLIVALLGYACLTQVMRMRARWTEKHPSIEPPSQ